MQKIFITFAILTFLTGCSTNEVKISGKTYFKNTEGEVILSKNEIAELRDNPSVVIVDKVMPDHGVTVSSEELALLSQDTDLFNERVSGKVHDGIYIFAVKKGSLKANLTRLSEKFSTKETKFELDYEGVDYFISEAKVIRSSSLELLVSDILNEFPVLTTID